MLRIPILDVVVGFGLAIVVSLIFSFVHPELSGERFGFAVGEVTPEAAASIGAPTFSASVGGYRQDGKDRHVFTITSPVNAAFTITGSTNYTMGTLAPMQLWINGRPITFSMLAGDVSAADTLMHRRPIAKNVVLHAGDNEMTVRTRQTEAPLIFEFYRQRPVAGWRSAAVGLAVLAALWAISLITRRLQRGVLHPIATIAATLVLFGAAAAWIAADCGEELLRTGDTSPDIYPALAQLERDMAALPNRDAGRIKRVATFGDSTHEYPGGFEFRHALAKSLERDRPGEFAVFGMAHGGMSGWDYYRLLNKAIEAHPDVLVLPINLPTFESIWYDNPMWFFDSMDYLVRFDEFPRAVTMRLGERRLRWEKMVIQKADVALTDRMAGRFVTGLRLLIEAELRKKNLELNAWRRGIPADEIRTPLKGTSGRVVTIERDNEMVGVFNAIVAAAHKHGIRVILYTTPIDEESQEKKSIVFRPDYNFGKIQRGIAARDGLTFLTLHTPFPKQMFRDDFVHLNVKGIEFLADHVARAVESAEDDPSGKAPVAPQ